MSVSAVDGESQVVNERQIEGRDGSVLIRDYIPANPSARTPFLWVHGGGFSSGGLDQRESDAPARAIAASGRLVRTVDYRLAPRANPWRDPDLSAHPGRYPAAFHDVVDAARSLMGETQQPISVGGGSAGANLAAAAALALRDEDPDMTPRALALAYGTFHAVLPPSEDVESELKGVLAKWAFNPPMLRRMNLNYVGDPDLLVPGYAFPGGANLRGLPPTLILDSRNDRLRKSGHAFADELRAVGTDVSEVVLPTIHGFLNKPKGRAFADGMPLIIEWLASHD